VLLAQPAYWYGLGTAILLLFAVELLQCLLPQTTEPFYSYIFWTTSSHHRRARFHLTHGWLAWLWSPPPTSSLAPAPAQAAAPHARIQYKRSPASAEAGISLRSMAQPRPLTPEQAQVTRRSVASTAAQAEPEVGELVAKQGSLSDLRRITEESLDGEEEEDGGGSREG